MWEGNQPNPDAVLGANSLLFFLTDEWKKLNAARERLNKIRSLPGGFEVSFLEGGVEPKLGVGVSATITQFF